MADQADQKTGETAPEPESSIRVVMLVLNNGQCPVDDWLDSIRDKVTRARLERQIDKLSRGLGVQKGLAGIAELKIDLGPGYRIYYAYLNAKTLIVLLGGGDKSRQSKDIAAARALWEDFQTHGQPDEALRAWHQAQAAATPPEEGNPA